MDYRPRGGSSAVSSASSSSSPGPNNVKVCVRLRPLSQLELQNGDVEAATPASAREIRTRCPIEGGRKVEVLSHLYDEVLPQGSSQEDVFATTAVARYVKSALSGFTATIMAYGQTGSGKTHTMFGPADLKECAMNGESVGIIPRAVRCLFADPLAARAVIKASFLQIYNEQVYDLLNPTDRSLNVRMSANRAAFFVEQLLVVTCSSEDDLYAVIEEGIANRTTASHLLNADSSRSHSIMTIWCEQPGTGVVGKLNLVDLAGSERLKETGSSGQNAVESCHINKSLLALGQVVSVLSSTSGSRGHVPYRDSKLTKLLMDSLGGSCQTMMIACVTPASSYIEETLNTLKYATRTRCIQNSAPERMRTDPQQQLLADLQNEVLTLRAENEALKARHVHDDPCAASTPDTLSRENARLQRELAELRARPSLTPITPSAPPPAPGVLQLAQKTRPQRLGSLDGTPSPPPELDALRKRCAAAEAEVAQLKEVVRKVGDGGLAAVVEENVRLARALRGLGLRGEAPPPPARELEEERRKVEELSKQCLLLKERLAELELEVEQLTTTDPPDALHHLLERREARLLRRTNEKLREQIRQLLRARPLPLQ